MLNKLKIGLRLGIGFGLVILLTTLSIVFVSVSINSIEGYFTTLYENSFMVKSMALEANANIIAVHRAMKDVALSENVEQLEAAVKSAKEYDEKVQKDFGLMRERFLGDKSMLEETIKAYTDWAPIREETIELMRAGEKEKSAENTKTKGAVQVSLINRNMTELIESVNGRAENFYNEANQTTHNTGNTVKVIGTVIIVLSVVIAIFATRSISLPLRKLSELVNEAAKGDLTAEYKGKTDGNNEISSLAKAFNAMIGNLRSLVIQAAENSATVATSSQQLMAGSQTATAASEEIASSIQQVALGAEKQNRSLKDVAYTLSELAKGTEQTAANMQEISNEVGVENKLSGDGKNDLNLIINQMNVINETSQESVNRVKSLEEKSQAIQGIVEVITNISGQTNLLALNAAIEAARAGEQGKGFAVVADEIRKLAEQSSNSTKDISAIVKEIQKEILAVINSIENEEKNIEEGLIRVNTANESFDRIAKGIREITNRVQEVSAVAQQMSAGTEQVVNAITSISDISGENAAISEEVAASVEEQNSTMEEVTASAASLAELSANLLSTVSKFKIK